MEYKGWKLVHQTDTFAISTAISGENCPVVVVTTFEPSTPSLITKSNLPNLKNFVELKETSKESHIFLKRTNGISLKKLVKSGKLEFNQRVSLANEFLKITKNYDDFPGSIKIQLIDLDQIEVVDTGVILREIVDFGNDALVSDKELCAKIGKVLSFILPDATGSDGLYIEQLISGTANFSSFAEIYRTFREVFIYDNTDSLKTKKNIIIFNDTTKPTIKFEDIRKFEYEVSLKLAKEERDKLNQEAVSKLENVFLEYTELPEQLMNNNTSDVSSNRQVAMGSNNSVAGESSVNTQAHKGTYIRSAVNTTEASFPKPVLEVHEYVVGGALKKTKINPRLIGLTLKPLFPEPQEQNTLRKSEESFGNNTALVNSDLEAIVDSANHHSPSGFDTVLDANSGFDTVFDANSGFDTLLDANSDLYSELKNNLSVDSQKEPFINQGKDSALSTEIGAADVLDESEMMINKLEQEISSLVEEGPIFTPPKYEFSNFKSGDSKVLETHQVLDSYNFDKFDEEYQEEYQMAKTDRLVEQLKSHHSDQTKNIKNILMKVILGIVVAIFVLGVGTLIFKFLEPVKPMFEVVKTGETSFTLINQSSGSFNTESYKWEVYFGGKLLHTLYDREPRVKMTLEGDYLIKLYAIEKNGNTTNPYEYTFTYKTGE